MVLSFNKHTTSLVSSTRTLIPRSGSQVILTSMYLAKKVTWFKGISQSGLWSLAPAPVIRPQKCVLQPTSFCSGPQMNCAVSPLSLWMFCLQSSMPFPVRCPCGFHFLRWAFLFRITLPDPAHLPRTATCPPVYTFISFWYTGLFIFFFQHQTGHIGRAAIVFLSCSTTVSLLLRTMLGTQLELRKHLLHRWVKDRVNECQNNVSLLREWKGNGLYFTSHSELQILK